MLAEPTYIPRAVARQATDDLAVAMLNADKILDCVITDYSPKGARLRFKSAVPLPGKFTVLLRRTGENSRARLIWQCDREAGVQFEHPPISTEELTSTP